MPAIEHVEQDGRQHVALPARIQIVTRARGELGRIPGQHELHPEDDAVTASRGSLAQGPLEAACESIRL
jgi:hypothetical protein